MNHLTERRQEEKARRRSEILDAAESVAATVGIEAMTMDQVARRARLSRALLYVYFEHKADLLFGLCNRALDILQQRFIEAVSRHKQGLRQVEACGRAYVAFAQEFPVYFESLAKFEAHSLDPNAEVGNEGACVLAGDRVHAVLIAAIEQGIRDGSVRPDAGPPPLISFTLWAFMHGVIQLASTKAALLAHDGVTTQQLVDQALLQSVRSLAQPG